MRARAPSVCASPSTLTTFGGFLPLILAGGVLPSVVRAFAFVPAMFRLVYAARPSAAAVPGSPERVETQAA
jgi:hypothetical protein